VSALVQGLLSPGAATTRPHATSAEEAARDACVLWALVGACKGEATGSPSVNSTTTTTSSLVGLAVEGEEGGVKDEGVFFEGGCLPVVRRRLLRAYREADEAVSCGLQGGWGGGGTGRGSCGGAWGGSAVIEALVAPGGYETFDATGSKCSSVGRGTHSQKLCLS